VRDNRDRVTMSNDFLIRIFCHMTACNEVIYSIMLEVASVVGEGFKKQVELIVIL